MPDAVAPTIARLSFWVSPDRRAQFSAALAATIAPLLDRHGWSAVAPGECVASAPTYQCWYEFASLPAFKQKQQELESDPAWTDGLRDLKERLGADPDTGLRYSLKVHTTPALPANEQQVEYRGTWLTIDAADGLAANMVFAVCEDSRGHLWFATENGATRYDGDSFRTYTTRDGLPHSTVAQIYEDAEGALWFGTYSGLSRYDGREFTSYTTRDGLAQDQVTAMAQDRCGRMWYGSGFIGIAGSGVSCFDGHSFTVYSTEDGLPDNTVMGITVDRTGDLWFGTLGGVGHYDGHSFSRLTTHDGLAHNAVIGILEDRSGSMWFGTYGGGVSVYDGKEFTSFTTEDGLGSDVTIGAGQDNDGHVWFGTQDGGVSRYNGNGFTTFTMQDGLTHNHVNGILEDREGRMWFSTYGGGVSRYDPRTLGTLASGYLVTDTLRDGAGDLWVSSLEGVSRYRADASGALSVARYASRHGLSGNMARCLCTDRCGRLWIGFFDGYVTRHDGRTWRSMGPEDGLPDAPLFAILESREGDLWFGTQGGGVCRFDGDRATTLTTRDGLCHDDVRAILQDSQGRMWFGTFGGGLSVYDGGDWLTYTTANGLTDDYVQEGALFEDREGRIWIGTKTGGVVCFNGTQFTSYTSADGLSHDTVWSISQDDEGHIWIGTSGGVTRYDGIVFQSLTRGDGLASNGIMSIRRDPSGSMWIGTTKELGCYSRPDPSPPSVTITSVIAEQRHEPDSQLTVPASAGLTVFEFHGVSPKTRPGGMLYRYRLDGHDQEWQTTGQERAEYQSLPAGEYHFEVAAVDRDLVRSADTARITLTVLPDPRDEQIDELEQRVRERTRELEETHKQLEEAQDQLIEELRGELQTARELQMGLMPLEAPDLPGLQIAGRCLTANHVGGDFFQYFGQDDEITVSLADVTGHAMDAAIPAVMFSGVLDKQMEIPSTLEERFVGLNRSLCRSLSEHTYVCLSMVEIALQGRTLRVANCGCPYPLHYHAETGDVSEWRIDAYPLGVRQDTAYKAREGALKPGDYLLLYSDGFPEAANADGDMFGFEHTADVIRQGCSEGLEPEELVEHLIGEAKAFSGDEPQADDMTCVVLKVEE